MQQDKINRFGICPNCGTNWKGKDILEELSQMSCNSGKSTQELIKLASQYGWSVDNKVNFSSLKSTETADGRHLLQCPKMTCQHVFDRYRGVEFRSMYDALRNAPIIKEVDFPTGNIPLADPDMYIELMRQETDVPKEYFGREELHVTKDNRDEIERKIEENIGLQNKISTTDEDAPPFNPDN